jgi:hypothetical protein
LNRKIAALASSAIALLFLSASGLWGQAAAAGSRLSASVSSPSLSYRMTADSEAAGTITVKRSGSNKSSASFYVAFTLVSLSSTALSGGESLSYGLYKNSTSKTALSLTGRPSSSDDVLSGTIGARSSSASLNYVFRVSNATFPAPGTYIAQITAKVYNGSYSSTSSSTSSSSASATITATLTVDRLASVAVVGGASDSFSFSSATANPDYSLDLGDLSANTTGRAYILVCSNASYSLALSSVNGGSLINADDASSIAYEVAVDKGSSYSLTTAATTIVSGSATYGSPERHSIIVSTTKYGADASAGTYTDTITVTVSAS